MDLFFTYLQRVWDPLPSTLTMSFFSQSIGTAARCLWPQGLVLGGRLAVPRPFAAPAPALLARRGCQDEPSSCHCAHGMEMQPDKSESCVQKEIDKLC